MVQSNGWGPGVSGVWSPGMPIKPLRIRARSFKTNIERKKLNTNIFTILFWYQIILSNDANFILNISYVYELILGGRQILETCASYSFIQKEGIDFPRYFLYTEYYT
jgi:hypothetical protein